MNNFRKSGPLKKRARTWEQDDEKTEPEADLSEYKEEDSVETTTTQEKSAAMVSLQAELDEKEIIQKANEAIAAHERAQALAEEVERERLAAEEKANRVNPVVWFDISLANSDEPMSKGEAVGKITMELFADTAPKTVENFRCLCTGEKGVGANGFPLHYSNNIFHRIVGGYMMQGGDITRENGTGGESIYGPTFADEPEAFSARKHDARGLLSMANAGVGTENSQFFILFEPAEWLDGKHSVFGKVISGDEVLEKVEACGTSSGKPSMRVIISACGQVGYEPPAVHANGNAHVENPKRSRSTSPSPKRSPKNSPKRPEPEFSDDGGVEETKGGG